MMCPRPRAVRSAGPTADTHGGARPCPQCGAHCGHPRGCSPVGFLVFGIWHLRARQMRAESRTSADVRSYVRALLVTRPVRFCETPRRYFAIECEIDVNTKYQIPNILATQVKPATSVHVHTLRPAVRALSSTTHPRVRSREAQTVRRPHAHHNIRTGHGETTFNHTKESAQGTKAHSTTRASTGILQASSPHPAHQHSWTAEIDPGLHSRSPQQQLAWWSLTGAQSMKPTHPPPTHT